MPASFCLGNHCLDMLPDYSVLHRGLGWFIGLVKKKMAARSPAWNFYSIGINTTLDYLSVLLGARSKAGSQSTVNERI